jgi:hypothetical protein
MKSIIICSILRIIKLNVVVDLLFINSISGPTPVFLPFFLFLTCFAENTLLLNLFLNIL